MDTKDYLYMLCEEIHSVVAATVDKDGLPASRAMDVMLEDGESIYFLTAIGKDFYDQLMNRKYISISGMSNGGGTMDKKAISLSGKVREADDSILQKIFEKNPYMAEIYPIEEGRKVLKAFQLYEGQGMFFDLTKKPITKDRFVVGRGQITGNGYYITEACKNCGRCAELCPQGAIIKEKTFRINSGNCINCGECLEVCPYGAVERTR